MVNDKGLTEVVASAIEHADYPVLKGKEITSVAYALSFLAPTSFLISVFVWWPELCDEHGRKGLLFCHHVHCVMNQGDTPFGIIQVAVGLVSAYNHLNGFLANTISEMASKPVVLGWEDELSALTAKRYDRAAMDRIYNAFQSWFTAGYRGKINVFSDFPYQDVATIPCLFAVLLNGKPGMCAAGGQLDSTKLSKFGIISCIEEVPTFRSTKLSVILVASNPSASSELVVSKGHKRKKDDESPFEKPRESQKVSFWSRLFGEEDYDYGDKFNANDPTNKEQEHLDSKRNSEAERNKEKAYLEKIALKHKELLNELESHIKQNFKS